MYSILSVLLLSPLSFAASSIFSIRVLASFKVYIYIILYIYTYLYIYIYIYIYNLYTLTVNSTEICTPTDVSTNVPTGNESI